MAIKLARTPSTAGNQKTWTFSTWYKRSYFANGGATANIIEAYYGNQSRYTTISFDLNDTVCVFSGVYQTASPASYNINVSTDAKFRDLSNWYHVCVTCDTTEATNTDRIKIWVNGVLQTCSLGTAGTSIVYPTQNSDTFINSTIAEHYLCSSTQDNRGYMAHTHLVDGTAYNADTFGEFDANGVWKPKTSPSISDYGINGFFMKYENSSNFGLDSSSKGNNLTVTGTPTQAVDTPSNVFATLNPLHNLNTNFSYGNTKVSQSTAPCFNTSTLAPLKGKWYWEAKFISGDFNVGIMNTETALSGGASYGSTGWVFSVDGNVYHNGILYLNTGYGTLSANDIVGYYLDLDNGTLKIQVNGSNVYSGNAVESSIPLDTFYYITCDANTINNEYNFGNGYFGSTAVSTSNSDANGQGIFEYSPTLSGVNYYALCTKNLATYG